MEDRMPKLDDKARSQISLIDQDSMRKSVSAYIREIGLSPEIFALTADVSMTTLKRWLANETNVQQAIIRRMLAAFPDMGERMGLQYDYGPLKSVPILGKCYGSEIRPLAPSEKERHMHIPQSVSREYTDDWFAVIVAAANHKRWRGATVLVDCSVKLVAPEEFMENLSYMLMEKETGRLYIGWAEVEDLSEGVRLTDGRGMSFIENLEFEYAHPCIGYIFNTCTV